ncbi:hypothetical protein IT399_00985 [Candidatus Nomurabacteria bacterium]|nr:hypothetical protein [Candidatus Nomurabacteria bacterium]
MKDILLNFKGFENNIIFTKYNADDLNGPWKYLKNKLASIGYDLKTADDNDLSTAEKIIFVDEVTLGKKITRFSKIKTFAKKILGINKNNQTEYTRDVYAEAIKMGLRKKMALILWEARAIDPDNYTEETYGKFDTIITWNDDLVDNKKFFKFFHPYSDKERPKPAVLFRDKKMLVNISINKISNHNDELYSERRKSISFFEKEIGEKFDLFGYNWNKPISKYEKIFPFLIKKYKSYRGECRNKHEILAQYKFSLCYENVKNENGWITEKIFDCFNARVVPIYWGAQNITKYIPKETFIDRRNFKNNKELLFFLESITEKQYDNYIKAIDSFLGSDDYKKFLPDNFFICVSKALKLKI